MSNRTDHHQIVPSGYVLPATMFLHVFVGLVIAIIIPFDSSFRPHMYVQAGIVTGESMEKNCFLWLLQQDFYVCYYR